MRFNRALAIETLVGDDIAYVNDGDGLPWLEQLLINGFPGYSEQSDWELQMECEARDIPFEYYMEEV